MLPDVLIHLQAGARSFSWVRAGQAPRQGKARKRPEKLHADKRYDFSRCRKALRERGIKGRIARRGKDTSAGVRRLRSEQGFSKEEFSFRVGLHQTCVSSVEWGERNATIGTADEIAKCLGFTLAGLLLKMEQDYDIFGYG